MEKKENDIELGSYKRSNYITITFKIPRDEMECLSLAVRKIGLTHRSELIRMALRRMLRELGVDCAKESMDS